MAKPTVRILGPVSIDNGLIDEPLNPRLRRLFAALAIRWNEPVAEAGLIDAVWSETDALPANPTRSLQTYVSRLRAYLGAGAIERQASSYRLAADVVELDAATFEHLLAQVSSAGEEGRSEDAVDLVNRALAQWNGAALDEYANEHWAAGEAARLDALRVDARERRAAMLIDLGRVDGTLLAELEALAAEHPHREEPASLLMRALYRANRQADALAAFGRFRDRLATDLGLEPSEELRLLEEQVVTDDRSAVLGTGRSRPLRAYEIDERMGEGAFSIVYRGRQPSVNREVAIKQIRAELANRPEFIRRFETEAHFVARLEHPFIVPIYDFWREPNSAYLVMRYLRGGSLEHRLRTGALAVAQVGKMVGEIGSALATAHRAGIIHRDVKPANILFDDEGNAFLADFGIALDAEEAADPEAALSAGSPAYASPEQLRREQVGPPADVHGLAIATYEALTGHLPFPDEATHAALLKRQLHDPIPAVSLARADVPAGIDTVLATATAKDPANRYPSVELFVEAMDRALAPTDHAPVRPQVITVITDAERNPYKGLRAFDEADAADFAGRARLVDELVEVLAEHRLLAVVGPSGSGKSSVVRAGLLPAIRSGRPRGASEWFVTTLLPGPNPFEELEAALLRIAAEQPAELLEVLESGPRGIARALRRVAPGPDDQVLLVIDQFEELFTLADAEQANRFLDALAEAVTEERSRLRVVLTLRADFYDRPRRTARPGCCRSITIRCRGSRRWRWPTRRCSGSGPASASGSTRTAIGCGCSAISTPRATSGRRLAARRPSCIGADDSKRPRSFSPIPGLCSIQPSGSSSKRAPLDGRPRRKPNDGRTGASAASWPGWRSWR